ncbi:thioredoxin-disulfide reductase [Sodaliphilus sp.]|uniref:thioredoxin-disulfide reductase n=1 Tax=Sodaliphilus sp. TaxID=2815818 RepID=UPI00388DFFBF
MKVKCLIIGSGPAGYTAAIYVSRAGISNLLVEGHQPGGQLTTTTMIENFPGFPSGIDGFELMQNMRQQAINVGADVKSASVKTIDLAKRPFVALLDDETSVEADSVIIATGASARYLGLPDENKYAGQGVSACATCDGFFYRKRDVAVVGGGDTACEEATYLSNLCRKVYMIVRKDHLRAQSAMQKRVAERENIELIFNANTTGLFGEDGLDGAHLIINKGTENEQVRDIAINGFFLAIGHKPNTSFLAGQLELDEQGYIVTDKDSTATSVNGVFAAGDVANPRYRQAIAAAGTGCRAALDVEHFLNNQ